MTREDIIQLAKKSKWGASGSKWLVTDAGAERFAALVAAAKREPATDDQIAEADENHAPSWLDYRDGWRDAERFHGIRGSNT
jgi:hypothetical protein